MRAGLSQMPGRPHAQVATADDDDIGRELFAQLRARDDRTGIGQPEAVGGPLHREAMLADGALVQASQDLPARVVMVKRLLDRLVDLDETETNKSIDRLVDAGAGPDVDDAVLAVGLDQFM